MIILLSLSEVFNCKSRTIKESSQAKIYFKSGSQAALWRILSDWARAQKSAVGRCEQNKDDIKKHQQFSQPRLFKYLRRALNWCQLSNIYSPKLHYFSKFSIFYILYLLTSTATVVIGSVSQSQPIKATRRQCNTTYKNITS